MSAISDRILMALEPVRRPLAVLRAAWSLEAGRPRLVPRTADELEFLPAALELIETPPSPFGRGTLYIVTALFASAVLWACLGEVDIHATARGRIIPGGKTKAVAPAETASVSAIRVKDGDHVSAGQLLVELDPAGPGSDVERLARERLEQQVNALRLQALLDGRPDFAAPADAPADLVEVNRQELRHKLADHHAEIEALESERRQKEAERRAVLADQSRLQQTVPLLEERSRAKGQLSDEGYISRTEYLRVRQEYIDRKQELDGAQHKLAESEAAIADAAEKRQQAEEKFRADALSHLADARQKADSLEQELAKARDRQRLYRLVAPVSGVVQQLSVHAAGAVATQGQPVLMIVPDDEGIAVEADLPSRDVGFVRPGQQVEIKVDAFPFTRYGTIPGEVAVVSGDALEAGDGNQARRLSADRADDGLASRDQREAVYSVRVRPSADHIRADGQDEPLTPGMTVTAEIKTGRRRVIEYLLEPVLRYRDESLRER